MKKKLRKGWMLGFLGLMSIMGLKYFQSSDWLHLTWFTWILWFTYFIPVKTEK